MRRLSCVLCCALFTTLAGADDKDWATIKGRVVFPEDKPIPKRQPLNVNQDGNHCLANGPILDESVIVNPKNRGIKNVVVFLRPDDPAATEFPKDKIHPDDAKRKPAEVVIDQPCCMFVNRVTVARVGDTLAVKNSAPVVHNFFWSSTNNGEYNQNVPKNGKWVMHQQGAAEPWRLVPESTPIQYKCTIHGWMTGYVRIFDHPYYAVTDDDGKFEIKNAPTGKYRIVYWHESGLRGGPKGRFGEPITITGPTMEMKPVDFEVK
jgi:hypothetical protein